MNCNKLYLRFNLLSIKRIPASRPIINRKLVVQTSTVSLFLAHQDFRYTLGGLPNPLTTVKCVLLATDAVSTCFGAVTVGGCIVARFARLAAVKRRVPEAAL